MDMQTFIHLLVVVDPGDETVVLVIDAEEALVVEVVFDWETVDVPEVAVGGEVPEIFGVVEFAEEVPADEDKVDGAVVTITGAVVERTGTAVVTFDIVEVLELV